MKMLRTSLGDDVDFPNKFPPWTRNVATYSPGSLLIPPSLFSLCNVVGRADPPYGNNSSSSMMTQTFGRGIPGGQEEPSVNNFNTGSHIRQLSNGGVDSLTDMEVMSKFLGTFCSTDLTSLANKCGFLSSPNLDTSKSIPSQIPQSSNRSGSRNGKWDLNKPSAISHAINSAFSVSEWDKAPCTLSHGLVNQSQTEARSSGLSHPPRSRLESSNIYSTLPFSALNLIERDKTGQEIIGQHLDTAALRIPASTSNQTFILSTTDGTNCETSPDSNSEGSMTEHHERLNASHSPQNTFLRSDSKRHLEVPSYFDTIFQHLLEVYNQVKSSKVSEPPVSLFLCDGFSRDLQKSPTTVDNKPQCKLPSLVPGNLSMDPLRPTNVWFGSNGTNSGAHHHNHSVSSSSSQNAPKGLNQSETQVDALLTPSRKTGNDLEQNSFGQPENGITLTPEIDITSLQTMSIPRLSQGANYFYYGLQLMAKSFMSRYLHSNPNDTEKEPVTKVSTTTDE
ncbi:hypothetical protein CRM22_009519 [Opisthorchis felineus]|uniref:Uncharacterized protein n=1 Tax=Opisthorchis felineus TaxID=147828 RepID=A0A4S2L743_OPIFE|nr:hypothetical protein CRM22_009519 [Opisthorchis felineus]